MLKSKGIFLCLYLCTVLAILTTSCANDYYSPLIDKTIKDLSFDFDEDSCLILLDGVEYDKMIINSTESWCFVTYEGSKLKIKVSQNDNVVEREAIVSITDPKDNSLLTFKVKQLFNKDLLNRINNIELVSANGKRYKPFLISDDAIHIIVSPYDNIESMQVRLEHTGKDVYIDNHLSLANSTFDFSDFTTPHVISLVTDSDSILKWDVIIYNLPVLVVNTPDLLPIESKIERKEGCVVSLVMEDGKVESLGTAGIRGRGNSTWEQPQKPYNIKFDKKQEILGMNKSKHWILLANAYYDRTQLHNATAFEIARLTDYPWVQSGQFVELVLNGSHKGLYYLCEKIGIEKTKINIEPEILLDERDCGYLLESYVPYEEDPSKVILPEGCFQTNIFNKTGGSWVPCTLAWEIKEPENYTKDQIDYLTESICYMERLLKDSLDSGKYRELFDIETAINWWLVEELCSNSEASRTKNVFLYKAGLNGKFCVGPPWDLDAWTFEQGGGNFWSKECALYFSKLFEDPVFVERTKEKWTVYKKIWEEEIPLFIEQQYNKIHLSAKRNELMWPDYYYSGTYEETVENMRSAFLSQIKWMDVHIMDF